jgi:PTH1 family peptidyl-tRNA hydrolase
VDLLAQAHGLTFDKVQHRALVATGAIKGQRVVLAKPLTYMNLSGQAVGPLVRWHKVPLDQLLVIYDDLDLPLGTIRLRPRGGAGGHKGMRSIITELSSQDFPRLRLGIGRPPAGWDPADYVLSDFGPDELPVFRSAAEIAVQAIECWLSEGLITAMNRFNTKCGDYP